MLPICDRCEQEMQSVEACYEGGMLVHKTVALCREALHMRLDRVSEEAGKYRDLLNAIARGSASGSTR